MINGSTNRMQRVYQFLDEAYGLTQDQCRLIMNLNDCPYMDGPTMSKALDGVFDGTYTIWDFQKFVFDMQRSFYEKSPYIDDYYKMGTLLSSVFASTCSGKLTYNDIEQFKNAQKGKQ